MLGETTARVSAGPDARYLAVGVGVTWVQRDRGLANDRRRLVSVESVSGST